jgi:hypothetical protein
MWIEITCDWLCDEGGVVVGMVSGEQIVVMECTMSPVVDTFHRAHVQKQKNDSVHWVPKLVGREGKPWYQLMHQCSHNHVQQNVIVPAKTEQNIAPSLDYYYGKSRARPTSRNNSWMFTVFMQHKTHQNPTENTITSLHSWGRSSWRQWRSSKSAYYYQLLSLSTCLKVMPLVWIWYLLVM